MNKLCDICGKEAEELQPAFLEKIMMCGLCAQYVLYPPNTLPHIFECILQRLAALEANQISVSKIGGDLGDVLAIDDDMKVYLDPETGRFVDLDPKTGNFVPQKEIPKHSHNPINVVSTSNGVAPRIFTIPDPIFDSISDSLKDK